MAYVVCEDCGTKLVNGICPNCNEEILIEGQYLELGESVPENLHRIAESQRRILKDALLGGSAV